MSQINSFPSEKSENLFHDSFNLNDGVNRTNAGFSKSQKSSEKKQKDLEVPNIIFKINKN